MSQEFKHLLSPIKIGSMTVRNRIYSSPHHPGYIDITTGTIDDRVAAYWGTKAKGGVGLIGTCLLEIDARPSHNVFLRPSLKGVFERASEEVHRHGGKIICQLANSGGQEGGAGGEPWAPTAMLTTAGSGGGFVSHGMTKGEIDATIEAFANAARLAQDAGMDGCSIHGSHGYMVNEFMSPYFNKRTDEYGGTVEGRMRFPLEMITAIRNAVGKDFVVGIRANAEEYVGGGYTLDEFLVMAPMLAKSGELDFLNVSVGNYTSYDSVIDPMYFPLNDFVYCAAAVKQVVDIPVVARGRITDPVQAEEILANNQGDMVSMVRAIITDPDFANKVRDGRTEEIRKCLGCNEGCWGRGFTEQASFLRGGMSCVMNPSIGREGLAGWGEFEPAASAKRVMVVGGGPAGLETARVAASRGHSVSLYEQGSELGGQTLIAARAPSRDGFLDLARYQTAQMKLLGVDVHLNTEVTEEMIIEQAPDAVVIATGSTPFIPDIPGADGRNVSEVRQVLNSEVEIGDNVVIIAGELGMQALGTADFLAEKGKKVEVLYPYNQVIPMTVEPNTRMSVYRRLYQNGAVVTVDTGVRRIEGSTVVAFNMLTSQERRIEGVDSVVIAYGGQPDDALYRALRDKVKEIHVAGDAHTIRKLHFITMDGATVGRLL